MGQITFVLGGARSGKSRQALRLLRGKKKPAFIATGQPSDKEMRQRIALHKKERPAPWTTFEEPLAVAALANSIGGRYDGIVLDCLTLWVANMMFQKHGEDDIQQELDKTLAALKKRKGAAVIVSNEVGLGIVPINAMARRFRDIAGRVNQRVAEKADKVIFMVSGIPWRIK